MYQKILSKKYSLGIGNTHIIWMAGKKYSLGIGKKYSLGIGNTHIIGNTYIMNGRVSC